MKPIKIILPFLLFFSIYCQAQEEQTKPRCDYNEWADRFGESEKYNSLLEEACKELNAGNYIFALQKMEEAIAIDSARNGIDNINVYIDSQHRRLKDFIENSSTGSPNTAELPAAPDIQVVEPKIQTPEQPQAPELPQALSNQPSPELKPDPVETAQSPLPEVPNEKKEEIEAPPVFEPIVVETELPAQKQSEPEILETPENDEIETVNFSETEKAAFQEKGMQKVKQLENFIFQIGSKASPMELSSQSIENALLLFDDPEKRTVQVSSINATAKPKFKIKQYLQRVRNLNYDEITIEWADLQYTSDFTKGPDGNYYAYVVFSQRFTGMKDSRVVYQDVTTKRTEIVLKIYEKAVQGELTSNWDVFLGDISVVQTGTN